MCLVLDVSLQYCTMSQVQECYVCVAERSSIESANYGIWLNFCSAKTNVRKHATRMVAGGSIEFLYWGQGALA